MRCPGLDYYLHMDLVQHDVVVYSDVMSCFHEIDGEVFDNPLICHTINLFWLLKSSMPVSAGHQAIVALREGNTRATQEIPVPN